MGQSEIPHWLQAHIRPAEPMSEADQAQRLAELAARAVAMEAQRPGALFKFAVGDTVTVVTHPKRPRATVTHRWPGAAFCDPYDENIYAVTGFVTKQRERSLERAEGATERSDAP